MTFRMAVLSILCCIQLLLIKVSVIASMSLNCIPTATPITNELTLNSIQSTFPLYITLIRFVLLRVFTKLYPLTPTVAMGTAIKNPVPDRVKPSFVIFDIRALWRSALSVRLQDIKNYKWWLDPVCYRLLYSCTRMATLGVKLSKG